MKKTNEVKESYTLSFSKLGKDTVYPIYLETLKKQGVLCAKAKK